MKWVAAGLCGYEVGAILTGRYPTLSELSRRHRLLGPVLVGSLAIHLYRQPRLRPVGCLLCPDPLATEVP